MMNQPEIAKPRIALKRIIAIIVIFSIALYLRILFINETELVHPVMGDTAEYLNYAINLTKYGIYARTAPSPHATPDSFGTPGYPLFLSVFLLNAPDVNHAYQQVLAWQVMLSAVIPVIVFMMCQYFLPPRLTLGCALLTALSPHLISINAYLLTESIFTFLLTATMCLFIVAVKKQKPYLFFGASLMLGAACLVRPAVLLFPCVIILLILFYWKPPKKYRIAVLTALGALIMWAPWSFYTHAILPPDNESPNLGLHALALGIYPDLVYKDKRYRGFPYREDKEYGKISKDFNFALQTLGKRVSEEPGRYIRWYLWGKLKMFWSWDIIAGGHDVDIYPVKKTLFRDHRMAGLLHASMKVIHPFLLLLSAMGIPLLLCKKVRERFPGAKYAAFVVTLLIYFSAIHIVLAPLPRYSIPLRPFLYISAFASLYMIISMFSSKHKQAVGLGR